MNIIWTKEYPELTAFTGIQKSTSGHFIANGINTNGVYNNLATTVKLDANCNPIQGHAYGQIPGYHVIPFHMNEINNHYYFTGYRIEQGWRTSYQIVTDSSLNSNSCYQRNFDVSVLNVTIDAVPSAIDYLQMGSEIYLYGPSPDASGFYDGIYSEFEINETINNSYISVGDDCGGSCTGSIEVSSTGASSPYTYEWSDGQTGEIANGLCVNEELVLLTGDQLGCFYYDTLEVGLQTPITDICLITVDSASSKNEIIWEKPITNTIEGFVIHREIAGNYNVVGFVDYDSTSLFIDNTNGVDPNITSYRYKISTVDTCGNESALSEYHETIHLTVNQGTGGLTNLIWDNYEGFPFSYNRIWKDSIGDGNWQLKDSVSNTAFTWTDPYNATISTIYRIEVVSPGACITSRANTYGSTRSNKQTIAGPPVEVGVEDISGLNFQLYPNPAKSFITISTGSSEPGDLFIHNLEGSVVQSARIVEPSTIIEIPELAKGIYAVQYVVNNKRVIKKLIIQ